MSKFFEYLQSIPPEELPDIQVLKLPPKMAGRIKKTISGGSGRVSLRPAGVRKRALAAILAAALTCAASMLVYAGSEPVRGLVSDAAQAVLDTAQAVKRLFTREEELIDQNAVFLEGTSVSGDITLTVDKAVRDGDTVYLYYTLSNTSGFTGDALLYDTLTLEKRKSGDSEAYLHVWNKIMGEKGIYAGDILYFLNGNAKTELKFILKLGEVGAGDYRLRFDRLFSYSDNSGPRYTDCVEELSAEFSLGEILNELPSVEYEPESPVMVKDFELTLESIRITPLYLELVISDRLGQRFEYAGYTFTAMDYLKLFTTPLMQSSAKPGSDEFNEFDENEFYEKVTDIRQETYRLYIKFKDNVSSVDPSMGGASWSYYPDKATGRYDSFADYGGRDEFLLRGDTILYTKYFTDPIYSSDIESIYLESNKSHYYDGESDIIVLWENKGE